MHGFNLIVEILKKVWAVEENGLLGLRRLGGYGQTQGTYVFYVELYVSQDINGCSSSFAIKKLYYKILMPKND